MNEIPHWNLDQLYAEGSAAIEDDLKALDTLAARFAARRESLASLPNAADFRQMVEELERVNTLAHRLSAYAALYFAQNTQNQKALALLARIDEKMADLGNELLFFEIWWKELPDASARPLAESLPRYKYWLERTRSYRPHTLAEAQEKIINLKNITGAEALIALYDSITGRYRYKSEGLPGENGRELSRDELMVHARSAEADVRAAAYCELYRVYGQDGPILGQMYQTVARDWRIENIRLRAYKSPAEVRHKDNDLRPESVAALLSVAKKNAPLFGEFFQLKAKALKLPKLRRYDLYAPLTADSAVVNFDDGVKEVMAAFEAFDPRFKHLAENIIKEKRFSAKPAAGKQGGAFCHSVLPADIPWVLMTYNGRRQDLFTLAHELGHGIHSQLAAEHSLFEFHATLPLAETASTFGEMLLAHRLLQGTNNKTAKADMLFHLLDDAYATVGRQAFFAMFEITAHEMIENGATVDELAEAYMANLREQFGGAVDISDEFRWEWVSIPHIFHTPFYVYAYTFGQLLVYSLWRQYQKEGAGFVPRLIRLLARGGSASPEVIVAESGLGPLDEAFWQSGFDVIAGMLAELKNTI